MKLNRLFVAFLLLLSAIQWPVQGMIACQISMNEPSQEMMADHSCCTDPQPEEANSCDSACNCFHALPSAISEAIPALNTTVELQLALKPAFVALLSYPKLVEPIWTKAEELPPPATPIFLKNALLLI